MKRGFWSALIGIAAIAALLTGLQAATRQQGTLKDAYIPNLGHVKNAIKEYRASGQWDHEIAAVCKEAQSAIDVLAPTASNPAMVLDIDETCLSNWDMEIKSDFGYIKDWFDEWEAKGEAPAIKPTLELFNYARSKNVAVFFITGRREKNRAGTAKNLGEAGFSGAMGLLMKPDASKETAVVYKSGVRQSIESKGYKIIVNVGDQESDLKGGYASQTFKLPNPMYYIP